MLETISSGIILYKLCSDLILKKKAKVLYIPTGEFLQLYTVSFLLKKRFPKVNVVLDVLNYGILDKSYKIYFLRLQKNGIGLFRSIAITSAIFITHSFMKFTISYADYIMTVSKDFVVKIKKDYKKDTIDFTPSGVNKPRVNMAKKDKSYLGVYIGRMTLEKGIFDVLSTWQDVIKKSPDARLALAGYADPVMTDAIHDEIKKKGIEENVTFLGDVTEKKKDRLLRESSLFIHLAHREPLFPVITILEGFSYGLPAIVYKMPVLSSSIAQFGFSKESMYIVENGNVKEAAKKIISYEKLSKDQREKKFKSAIHNASLFSWDVIAKKEFSVIQKFLT